MIILSLFLIDIEARADMDGDMAYTQLAKFSHFSADVALQNYYYLFLEIFVRCWCAISAKGQVGKKANYRELI